MIGNMTLGSIGLAYATCTKNKALEAGYKTFVVALDISKAFDRV